MRTAGKCLLACPLVCAGVFDPRARGRGGREGARRRELDGPVDSRPHTVHGDTCDARGRHSRGSGESRGFGQITACILFPFFLAGGSSFGTQDNLRLRGGASTPAEKRMSRDESGRERRRTGTAFSLPKIVICSGNTCVSSLRFPLFPSVSRFSSACVNPLRVCEQSSGKGNGEKQGTANAAANLGGCERDGSQ